MDIRCHEQVSIGIGLPPMESSALQKENKENFRR